MLSAGQGRRLLPLTASDPKCLLPVDGARPSLELQLRALARCGVERASVLVGFGAEAVEAFLDRTPIPGMEVEALYNPFYASTDNLVTCWLARAAMAEDFLLLNGDTLFEDDVARRLLESQEPVSVAIDGTKDVYDADDMKVSIDEHQRLRAVGKDLAPDVVDAESIGFMALRSSGVKLFREALDQSIRREASRRAWYLSVIHDIAQRAAVSTVAIDGLWWCEIDSPEDLEMARAQFRLREDEAPGESGGR